MEMLHCVNTIAPYCHQEAIQQTQQLSYKLGFDLKDLKTQPSCDFWSETINTQLISLMPNFKLVLIIYIQVDVPYERSVLKCCDRNPQ